MSTLAPWWLTSGSAVKHFHHGTTRTAAPRQTLLRVTPLQHAIGVTRVANITGLDYIGIPVTAVHRPNARSLSVSQGKGATLDAARASGLMESLELFHAEHVDHPIVSGSFATVRRGGLRVVDVDGLARPKRSTFTTRKAIPWIEGRELPTGEPVLVPFELVHTDFRFPRPPTSGAFTVDGNGLASGNHPLEAIVHGLCEVIERDATTLWFERDGPSNTRVDPATVDDAGCRELLDRYAAADVDVAIWDATTDVGVASFVCQIADLPGRRQRQGSGAHGMGCHPDRTIALFRALAEAAQCRLTWISGARDDARADEYDASDEAADCERVTMAVRGPMRSFRDVPMFQADTFQEDLEWILGRLERVGIAGALAVDLTKPEFGIPVVRVIVPGLEGVGFGASYATYRPGRRARRCRTIPRP